MADRGARGLAAILFADVCGYSRLMWEDDTETLAALRHLRHDLFEPAVADANGTVVKSLGDGWLVEFPSVTDAVTCALHVQEALARQKTLELRIGLHLGDITHEGEDIYGDGVNIAARLEQIAAPGSVVISDVAHRSLDGVHARRFADAGERRLKNIPKTVRVFAWGDPPKADAGYARRNALTFAVLPFRTHSDAGDAELLREGILTDLTDSVARLTWLRVIAAGTTQQFPPENRDIAAIGQELKADYLLDGDLRKVGDRVRANVRLIDASSGAQLSADRFESRYTDLFDLQDDIVALAVRIIEPNLMEAEHAALKKRPTTDIGLWPKIVELRRAAYSFRPKEMNDALALADSILMADPDNAYACGLAAFALNFSITNNWYADPQEGFRRLVGYLQRGLAIDPTNEYCRTINAAIELFTGRAWADPSAGEAIGALRRLEESVAGDPSAINLRVILAMAYARQGRETDALRETNVAERLSPRDPLLFLIYQIRGLAGLFSGDHEEAIHYCRRAISLQPSYLASYRVLIAALVAKDRTIEARDALAALMTVSPNETAAKIRAAGFTTEQTIKAMVSVGLPEE